MSNYGPKVEWNQLTEGTRIYYTGDMANASSYGVITKQWYDAKWKYYHVNVMLDDGRELLGLTLSGFQPSPGRRFWLESDYKAERKRMFEQMQANLAARQAAKQETPSEPEAAPAPAPQPAKAPVSKPAKPLTDTSDGFKAILQDIITRLDDLTCGESLSLKAMRKLEKACEELKELEDELFPVN